MLCVKCGREKTDGGTYSFFYGKVLGRERISGGFRTTYDIAGRRDGFLCRSCVRLAFLRSPLFLGIVASFVVAGLLVRDQLHNIGLFDVFIIVFCVLFFLGLVLGTFFGNRGAYASKTFGDNQLRQCCREGLRGSGYDAFLNRAGAVSAGVLEEPVDEPSMPPPDEGLERRLLERPEVIDFYRRTSKSWSAGELAELGKRFEKLGKLPFERLVEKFRPVEGSPLFLLLEKYGPRPDEFLVSADLDPTEWGTNRGWFVLTNRRILVTDGRDGSVKEVILADVLEIRLQGVEKKSLTFEMKSGEQVAFESMELVPSSKHLEFFIGAAE